MDLEFKDQVVLVTGGAGGIGTALSKAFSEAKAKVALTYYGDKTAAGKLAAELSATGTETLVLAYDMGEPAQAASVVEQIVGKWGRLDALVANAVNWPMLPPEKQMFTDVDWPTWSDLVNINLYGTAAIMQQAARQMLKQKYGRIVVMSTEVAIKGMPGTTPYSTAKAAIHGLVASLRWELGPHDVFVNFVSPGFNMTPKNLERFPDELRQQVASQAPTGRLSVPEDVAPTVVYLASKANRHITGEFISVSGGAD
jgi:3-oxoacyl-[acyl-carrier protein] reductase